jgi:succinoglycan biosynthesis protein ExoL
MHITFLLPVVGLPRHHKRIRALRRAGAETRQLGFERPDQLGAPDDQSVEALGVIRDRAYAERAATFLRALRLLRRELRDTDVVYCFGADLLALARAALLFSRRRPVLVLEVGDIVDSLVQPGLRGALARTLEKTLIGRGVLVVATSPAYLEQYYQGTLGLPDLNGFVIENKVDSEALPARPGPTAARAGVLRVGYFGQIRCARSWEVLKALAERGGERVQIEVRGFAKGDMLERIADVDRFPNMQFLGRYSVPEDLASIYARVDVSWMAYWDVSEDTWRWARSNRFYESCYFSTPMIGQAGKDDTRLVAEHDLGLSIDVTKPDEAVERILAIDLAHLEAWQANLAGLPSAVFALGREHEELLALLGDLAGRPH